MSSWKRLSKRAQERLAWKRDLEARKVVQAPKTPPARDDAEHREQVALIDWCDVRGWPYSEIYAIPNGGSRHQVEAARMKAEGVRAGTPDLFLPVARGGFFGLYIEMKAPNRGRVSDAQEERIRRLRAAGYRVCVAWGWDDARELLIEYCDEPPTRSLI